MPERAEEEPEEPDEPDSPAPDGASSPARLIPSVGLPGRDWEYSTKVLSVAEIADGATLVKLLTEGATDGWELAQVIDGGDKRVLLMRRPKRGQRESRRVGFAPPAQS
jgi:hypothetical protein